MVAPEVPVELRVADVVVCVVLCAPVWDAVPDIPVPFELERVEFAHGPLRAPALVVAGIGVL